MGNDRDTNATSQSCSFKTSQLGRRTLYRVLLFARLNSVPPPLLGKVMLKSMTGCSIAPVLFLYFVVAVAMSEMEHHGGHTRS